MERQLTGLSMKVLRALTEATARDGHPPTLDTLAGMTELYGKSGISRVMHQLQAFGLAEKRGKQWWPAQSVIVHLSDAELRFLRRTVDPDPLTAVRLCIERLMTSWHQAGSVRANLQEDRDGREAESEAKEARDPRTIF